MNILADASLPGLNEAFPAPCRITLYHHAEEVSSLMDGQEALVCRATLKVNHSLLKNHSLRYVATASSGTDHLDHHWLTSQGIRIIDAKGCNASAVADYVMACLAYLSQQQLISGKRVGVIGFGEVGTRVTSRLQAANFYTLCYDPLKELKEPDRFQSCQLEELYESDILCIHAELQHTSSFPSMNLINQHFLANLKPNCVIINAARGGIIDEGALLNAAKELIYCTDVYLNEPAVNQSILNRALLCTPHIAGHSVEAKYRAVAMISEHLHQLAGLPVPQYATPAINHSLYLDPHKSWEENILSIYNPLDETRLLKEAIDIKSAFLKVRSNHQQRHDFLLYANQTLNEQTRLLLGEAKNL